MSFNLGFIGGGNMSSAIVQGIIKNDTHPAQKIWVSGPHINNLKRFQELGTNVTNKNDEVFFKCDVIFLGVKPGMLVAVADDCERSSRSADEAVKGNRNILFISMLAGTNVHKLCKTLAGITDNKSVIRIMPNTPMAVGAGACIYTTGDTPSNVVTEEQCQILENLLKGSAICERISEPLMESMGSLVGCGPAFIYIVIEALADGAVKQGVPRALAQRFAAQVVVGSRQMVLQTGKHPGLLKDEVCSPGGTTICGVTALENGRLRATLINGIEEASRKSKELNSSM